MARRWRAGWPPTSTRWSMRSGRRAIINAEVAIAVDGATLRVGAEPDAALVRAAEAHRNREPVPITVRVQPGPVFGFRNIAVVERGEPGPRAIADPAKVSRLKPGDPATSAALRAAQAALVDYLRDQSRPLAKVVELRPVVDHAARIMDVTYVVDPGPVAGFGDVTIGRTDDVPPEVVRSFIYLEPGDPYSPKALADTRKSIATIPAIGSVRIREGERLDAAGNLPLFVEVTERPKRADRLLGALLDHRRPGGEDLLGAPQPVRRRRAAASRGRSSSWRRASTAPRSRASAISSAPISAARFAFSFMKPALYGSRYDWLLDGLATRERVGTNRYGGYTARYANVTTAIRRRFSDTFSVQAGIEFERGQTSDVLGQVDYTLVGIPLSVRYDSTDSLLDSDARHPRHRLGGALSDLPRLDHRHRPEQGRGLHLLRARRGRPLRARRPHRPRLDRRASDLDEIPSTRRFYAGGGGSVRGYAYRSLAPLGPLNQLIGGRSLFEASVEARIKVTDTIGIVPFFDAGMAFASSFPDFKERLQMSAGLGLRYYTAIGPIRVDVAAPLNPRKGDKPVALYVSIGQAF